MLKFGFVLNFINFRVSKKQKNFSVTTFCENKMEVISTTTVFCGLTLGSGEKLAGSNMGML